MANHDEEDALVLAMMPLTSMAFPLAVRSAYELDIFNIIAKAGEGAKISPEDIASQIGAKHPEAPAILDRIMRMLASYSLLSCSHSEEQDGKRVYGLSPASKYYVTNADGVQFGPTLNFSVEKAFFESWADLKDAIMEGGVPFERVHDGMNAFQYASLNPKFNEHFNQGMFNFTTIFMNKVLESYEGFKPINTLVDVGGGLGGNLKLITSKYPHIKGINFDLPHVIEHASTITGVEHVSGDMFESVPNGDAIFLKWILHDWDEEHCVKLLSNCHKAIPSDGKVIIVDTILADMPERTTFAKLTFQGDLHMFTNHHGLERTLQEFKQLATSSGFSDIKVVCCISPLSVIELLK